MISRKSARAIAEAYTAVFYKMKRTASRYSSGTRKRVPAPESLYDFLYENEYQAWFCNAAKGKKYTMRGVKEFFMRLHTGETLYDATEDWSWVQRQAQGQVYLENLAEDILNYWHNELSSLRKEKSETQMKRLLRCVELDGYIYANEKLLAPEEDILDTQEETGILKHLYSSLNLANQTTAFHHLSLSEEHYVAERWDDSIGNSRKFLECVLQEVAAAHSLRSDGRPLAENTYKWAGKVRAYLEEVGLLERKEKETLKEVYGLLSETGGHPHMARHDQARLLRHLALTLAQFVLIRYQGLQEASNA